MPAQVIFDRVRETSATTGTGAYALAGAVNGFRTFDPTVATGETCDVLVQMGTNWEVLKATKTGATTLARTTIRASSNAGAAVNWGVGTKDIALIYPAKTVAEVASGYGGSFGGCRLDYVTATSIKLSRFNAGSHIFIDGAWELIPAAGVSLASATAPNTADTQYYIYAFMSAGTMTLERSTTLPATDATYGHRIKAAAATRTLVGWVTMNSISRYTDSLAQRYVSSYFNRKPRPLFNTFTTIRSTSSATLVSVNAEITVEFFVWEDDLVDLRLKGYAATTSTAGLVWTFISVDGAADIAGEGGTYVPGTGGNIMLADVRDETEGYHFANLFGAATASTANWGLSNVGTRLTGFVLG